MLSKMKMSRQWQTFSLLLIYLKHSTEQMVILLNYDFWNEKESIGTEHYTY